MYNKFALIFAFTLLFGIVVTDADDDAMDVMRIRRKREVTQAEINRIQSDFRDIAKRTGKIINEVGDDDNGDLSAIIKDVNTINRQIDNIEPDLFF